MWCRIGVSCKHYFDIVLMDSSEMPHTILTVTFQGATQSIQGINSGQDMDMPGSGFTGMSDYWNESIAQSYSNGSIAASRLDDMVTRVMSPYFFLGQDQGYPSIDPSNAYAGSSSSPDQYVYTFNLTGTSNRDVRDDHADLIRALGAQSATLLKNVNGALPLRAPKTIGVFGNDAADITGGPYSELEEDIGTLPIGGGSGMFLSSTPHTLGD